MLGPAARHGEFQPSSRRWLVGSVLIALLGALLFVPAVWSGRIADDFVLEQTLQKAHGVIWAFSHNDLGQGAAAGHFYRPVWVLWNQALFWMSHSPALAHVANLVLFALLCIEVSGLTWSVTKDGSRGLVAGAFFATFPSHGESVAWISGNTDLLACVLALACVLVARELRPSPRRDGLVLILAIAAMLAKEIAFVLPVLVALAEWLAPSCASRSPRRWRVSALILLSAIVLFAIRVLIVGSLGGYGPAFTARRLLGSAATFVLAAFSAPQLQIIREPVLLAIPLAALCLVAAGGLRLRRSEDSRAKRVALLGVAWAVIASLPVLNQPIDLNTRNGDRLLLLASVGLVFMLVELIDLRRRWGQALASILIVVGAASSLQNAFQWKSAGVESKRLVAEIDRIATHPGSVVALSFPTDLGEAHLFPDALQAAVQESGRDIQVVSCAPMHPSTLARNQTAFRVTPSGVWIGTTSSRNPFALGVLSANSVSSGPGCETAKIPDASSSGLGTTLGEYVKPEVAAPASNIVYFDGRNFVLATTRRSSK